MTGEFIVFAVCMAASGLLEVLGLPLIAEKVPPNRVYGVRTRATLENRKLWYQANRIAGYWLIATGTVAGCVGIVSFALGLRLPVAPLFTLVPILLGICGMVIHCVAVTRTNR